MGRGLVYMEQAKAGLIISFMQLWLNYIFMTNTMSLLGILAKLQVGKVKILSQSWLLTTRIRNSIWMF